MKMKRIITLLVLLVLSSRAGAGELTLREALDLARDHSYELKKARSQQRAALRSVSAAERGRFPTLTLEGRTWAVDDLPSFEIDIPVGPTFKKRLGSKQSYQIDATLNLPIYTGGRIDGTIDQAKALALMREAVVRAEADRLCFSVRLNYYSLDRADNMLTAAEASLDRANIVAGNVRSLFEAGAADSVDLLEADLALSEASFARNRAEIERRQAEISLQLLLGIDPGDSLVLADIPTPPETMPHGVPAAENRPELAAAAAGIEAQRSAVGLRRSEYLPSVSLFGGYSAGKPNRDMFNDEIDDFFKVGAGLSWSFNLGNQCGQRVEAARLELEARQHDHDRVERDLDEAARLALEQLRLAHKEYLSARRRYELTSRNYRLAEKRHAQGDISTNHLLEIEKSLTNTQAALAAASAAYYMRYSGWLYATGSEELEKGR
jgi:outer membrane protein TolC